MIKELLILAISASTIMSVVLAILNYGVIKVYFIRLLETKYPDQYKLAGSPKFFALTENIENILSLRLSVDIDHQLKNRVNLYYAFYKAMHYSIGVCIALILIVWSVDFVHDLAMGKKYFLTD